MEKKLQETIDTLVKMLRQTVEGRCSIALAGAHAKGVADAASDIDLYMYVDAVKPLTERKRIVEEVADADAGIWMDENPDAKPWGGGLDFKYQGIPIEVVVRTFGMTDQRVEDALSGHFEIIPATWTSNGYYTFIHVCELSFIKPIYDPEGILEAYQKRVLPYPAALKESIIHTFWARANTWLDNFHYDSAIGREDIWFCGPIVMHTVMDLVQVIFAVNDAYFTGDKKLIKALQALPYCPRPFLENAALLMSAPPDHAALQKQRELLRAVRDELKEKMKG